MIKLILWLKFFHRLDRLRTWQGNDHRILICFSGTQVHVFLGSMGVVLSDFHAKAGLINLNQEMDFGKAQESLIQGSFKGEVLGERENY